MKREHSTVWIRKHARYFRTFVAAITDMYNGSCSVDAIISAARLALCKKLPAKVAGEMFALGLQFGEGR